MQKDNRLNARKARDLRFEPEKEIDIGPWPSLEIAGFFASLEATARQGDREDTFYFSGTKSDFDQLILVLEQQGFNIQYIGDGSTYEISDGNRILWDIKVSW